MPTFQGRNLLTSYVKVLWAPCHTSEHHKSNRHQFQSRGTLLELFASHSQVRLYLVNRGLGVPWSAWEGRHRPPLSSQKKHSTNTSEKPRQGGVQQLGQLLLERLALCVERGVGAVDVHPDVGGPHEHRRVGRGPGGLARFLGGSHRTSGMNNSGRWTRGQEVWGFGSHRLSFFLLCFSTLTQFDSGTPPPRKTSSGSQPVLNPTKSLGC